MEGKSKRGSMRKSWIDEVEEDFKAMGIEFGVQWPKTGRNGGRIYW